MDGVGGDGDAIDSSLWTASTEPLIVVAAP